MPQKENEEIKNKFKSNKVKYDSVQMRSFLTSVEAASDVEKSRPVSVIESTR